MQMGAPLSEHEMPMLAPEVDLEIVPSSGLDSTMPSSPHFKKPMEMMMSAQSNNMDPSSKKIVEILPTFQATSMQNLRPYSAPSKKSLSTSSDLDMVLMKQGPETSSGLVDMKGKKRRLWGQANQPDAHKFRGPNWKEHWVINLIHARGTLQGAFRKKAGKQGDHFWKQVYLRLCSACPDFDKDVEACRKKWQMIYADYKFDKAQNAMLGSERTEKCKWFDLVDNYMHDKALVVCTQDNGQDNGQDNMQDNGHDSGQDNIQDNLMLDGLTEDHMNMGGSTENGDSPMGRECKPNSRKGRGGSSRSIEAIMQEMVDLTKRSLKETKELEREKLKLLESIKQAVLGVLEKL